jgi:hypothetical protein
MAKKTKERLAFENQVDSIFYKAVDGLQLGMMQIPAAYKFIEQSVSENGVFTHDHANDARTYMIEKLGAIKTK